MITKQDIAIILIRILSLYLMLQSLSILPMSIRIYTPTPIFLLISHEFVSFILSIVLWFFAPYLAKTMTKETTCNSNGSYGFNNVQFEQLLISAMGLILLAISIPGAVGMVSYHAAIVTTEVVDLAIQTQVEVSAKSFLAKYIAGILLGMFFLVFSKMLANQLDTLRNKFNQITKG